MSNDAVKSFFDEYQNRFSAETITSYKRALNQFFSFSEITYDEVKSTHVRNWLASLEEKGLKPRSIQLKLSALKSFYHYCMEENLIKKNPLDTIRTPKIDDSLPYYLSKRQLALLQEQARSDVRDRAIVETLYSTGVRLSELLNIKLEDIKWDTRQIWIRKGKGEKERYVLFTYECAERLKAYLNDRKCDSIYLFANNHGGQLGRIYVEERFRQFSEELGFKVWPHAMRHTFASHLAEKNMPQSYLQDLLGHVNINSTRRYTRLKENARKKKYDQFQT